MKAFKIIAVAVVAATLAFNANAQTLKVPAASPKQTLEQDFALSTIKIEYSRPSVKGRVVFGDLVPYGKNWRTGANQSTKITFGEDVKVEGKPLAAGTYAMYTVPNKDAWDVVFSKDLTIGANVADYKAENDVARVSVKPTALSNKVETFTINVADITPSTANVEMCWENTRVAFNVVADDDAKIMKNIDASLAADSRPYYQAAMYYYDNNKDLGQALTWVNKAIDNNPNAYYMQHLKAKIQLKQKDVAGAIATAEKSMALAKEQKSDDYVKLNEKLIAEAKKQ